MSEADDRDELARALLQKRLDGWLERYQVTDAEFMAYVLPRISAKDLFHGDRMEREVRQFAREMRRGL